MAEERESVLSAIRRDMKEAPVCIPEVSGHPRKTKMMDGYVRLTVEQPLWVDPRRAKRRKRGKISAVIGVIVLAAAAFILIKTGVLQF